MNIQLNGLCKAYGDEMAVRDLNLKVEAGGIYCLLGKNGAGKSTLLNMIAGIIEPSGGEVIINGLNYKENELAIKKQMGIQSEFDQIIRELDAIDFLEWIGMLYDVDKEALPNRINNLLSYFFENTDDLTKPSKTYSSGMVKRLSVCAALLHKPNLLIMDEPFANLDPVAAQKLCNFLIAYKSPTRLILVSSHDLLYVEKIATEIGLLNQERLAFSGSLADFKENGSSTIDKELLKYLQPGNQDSTILNAII